MPLPRLSPAVVGRVRAVTRLLAFPAAAAATLHQESPVSRAGLATPASWTRVGEPRAVPWIRVDEPRVSSLERGGQGVRLLARLVAKAAPVQPRATPGAVKEIRRGRGGRARFPASTRFQLFPVAARAVRHRRPESSASRSFPPAALLHRGPREGSWRRRGSCSALPLTGGSWHPDLSDRGRKQGASRSGGSRWTSPRAADRQQRPPDGWVTSTRKSVAAPHGEASRRRVSGNESGGRTTGRRTARTAPGRVSGLRRDTAPGNRRSAGRAARAAPGQAPGLRRGAAPGNRRSARSAARRRGRTGSAGGSQRRSAAAGNAGACRCRRPAAGDDVACRPRNPAARLAGESRRPGLA